jgi:hypothetical protein
MPRLFIRFEHTRFTDHCQPPRIGIRAAVCGVPTSAHKRRPLVVPPPPPTSDDPHAHHRDDKPATHRCHYWRWAALLKRSLETDGDRCDRCGARMKLRALVIVARASRGCSVTWASPSGSPCSHPPRGPPFFKTRPVGRRLGELGGDPCRGRDGRRVTDRALVPACAPWTARSAQVTRLAPFACAYPGPRDRDFPHAILASTQSARRVFSMPPCPPTPHCLSYGTHASRPRGARNGGCARTQPLEKFGKDESVWLARAS